MKYINRKTLLYKSGVEYADYGLNHVEGCSHGCTYPCYAFMMKKRCGVVKTYREWIKPKLVDNALELLEKELPRLKDKINCVFLCFSTDPFMYKHPGVTNLTLNILKRLNKDQIRSTLITKGVYPKYLVNINKYNKNNDYGSTIVSLSEKYRKRFEPNAAPIVDRIKALRKLHEAGLRTWVSMEPYPTPNIVRQDIKKILNEISFVNKIVFGRWNYNKIVSNQKYYKEFYNSMAGYVIEFCKKKSIDVHIKEGTIDNCHFTKIGKEKLILNKYIKKDILNSSSSLIFGTT